MKKRMLMTCMLMMGAALFADSQDVGEGIDSELFLNPYIESELTDLSGLVVLDAGCGSASRLIEAAKNGATVCAIEPKQKVLEKAQAAVQKAGLESQVSLLKGKADSLPYEANTFDRALCVNVGASLPATTHIVTQDQFKVEGLGAHFREVARVMKDEGRIVIAAPASFDVLFTDGSRGNIEIERKIDQALLMIGKSQDPEVITKNLSEIEGVMRATFVRRDGHLKLIDDEKQLRVGEMIWCKIPNGVISAYYHSEEEYLVAIRNAGLTCEEIKRPCFFGNVKYNMWRYSRQKGERNLGEEYVYHHPFTIYYVVKKV